MNWLDVSPVRKSLKKSIKPPKVDSKEKIIRKNRFKREANKGGKNKRGKKIKEAKSINDSEDSDEYRETLEIMIEDALKTPLPKGSEKWIVDAYGKNWYDDFLYSIEDVKDELITSLFYPDNKTILLLQYCFILQQNRFMKT